MNNLKKTTSIKFDPEFISTIRFYMADDLDRFNYYIKMLFIHFRDYDLCSVNRSPRVNSFKREILAIVAKEQRHYFEALKYDDCTPWLIDTCAMNVATRIADYLDSWWNEGVTVNYG